MERGEEQRSRMPCAHNTAKSGVWAANATQAIAKLWHPLLVRSVRNCVSKRAHRLLQVALVLAQLLACSCRKASSTQRATATATIELATKTAQDAAPTPQQHAVPAAVSTGASAATPPAARAQPVTTFDDVVKRILTPHTRVLGVGELHLTHTVAVNAGGPPPATAMQWFTAEVLPRVAERTSHLIVETWQPPKPCNAAAHRETEALAVATQRPARVATELGALAQAARAAHVLPVALQLTCADFAALAEARKQSEEATILFMLDALTRSLTQTTRSALKAAAATASRPLPLVVVYSGAMHNDRAPPPGWQAWSYVAGLELADEAFVELDMVPRAQAYRDPMWRDAAWLPPKDAADTLYLWQRGPQSWVVLLPATLPAGATPSRSRHSP